MNLRKLKKICALLIVFTMIIQLMPQVALANQKNHSGGGGNSPTSTTLYDGSEYTEGPVGETGTYNSKYLYHHIDVRLNASYTIGEYIDGVYSQDTYEAVIDSATAFIGTTQIDLTKKKDSGYYEFQSIGHDFGYSNTYLNFNPGTEITIIGKLTYSYNDNETNTIDYAIQVIANELSNGSDYNKCPGNYASNNYGFDVVLDDSCTQNIVNSSTMNISKVWVGDENENDSRPDEVTVDIYRTSSDSTMPIIIDTVNVTKDDTDLATDTEGNTWSITIKGLENGKYIDNTWIPYTYTAVERKVDNYDSSNEEIIYTDANNDGVNEKVTHVITNTYSPNIGTIVINKTVKIDSVDYIKDVIFNISSTDGELSQNVTIKREELIANYDNDEKEASASLTVENIIPGDYVVSEVNTEINDYLCTTTPNDNLNVKVYKGDESSVDFVNSYTLKTTSFTVTKEWSDDNDRDGYRPESVSVQLYQNGNLFGQPVELNSRNSFSNTWDNLQEYKDGVKIVYSVEELNVKEGYQPQYTKQDNNLVITNEYIPKKINVFVNVEWKDEDDFDNIRPDEINVTLSDGKESTVKKDDNYKVTFEDEFKYQSGEAIEYTVTQEDLSDIQYTTETKREITDDGSIVYTFINTHIPVKTNITVKKVWNDDNNRDGIRPTSVQVALVANCNGIETQVDIITLPDDNATNSQNTWEYTWIDYPTSNAGNNILYSVKEISSVTGYSSEVNGFIITNTHIPEKIPEITIKKVWEDDNNRDGIRPNSIKVNLLVNGEIYKEDIILSKDKGFIETIDGLYKYIDGDTANYSIVEIEEINGYVFDESKSDNLTVVNVHKPATTSKNVKKNWIGDEEDTSKRPSKIFVQLIADGVEYEEPVELSNSTETAWTYTWNNLPVYKNGVEINYTVKEVTVLEDYDVSYSSDTFVITNTLKQPEVIPTEEPEVIPTEEPEVIPTEEPEIIPTEEPEIIPTEEPVIEPSEAPIENVVIEDDDTPNNSIPDETLEDTKTDSSPKTSDASNAFRYLLLMFLSILGTIIIKSKKVVFIKIDK